MITLTGLDYKTFHYLLPSFATLYEAYTPYSADGGIRLLPLSNVRRGRPRSMTAVQCLGLVLAWGRTRGSEMVLCMLFGVTASVCSLFIRLGRRLLLKILSRDQHAAVRMPTQDEIKAFQDAIAAKYSMLEDVYAVADGLKLYLEQAGDNVIQNMFYNGWTHDHYVGNVFVFAPNGCIIASAINAPDAMHDSTIAEWGKVYQKLEEVHTLYAGRCVADSAFSKGNYPFLIKSVQDHLVAADDIAQVTALRQATSVRQGAEWGMRAFQGSFPRMKDRFVYEERGERKVMILCTVLFYNLRARKVGLNQILNTFMPEMGTEANCFLQIQWQP